MKYGTKVKIQDFYIKHKNYFGLGFSLVYDFKTFGSLYLLGSIFLKTNLGIEVNLLWAGLFFLVCIMGFWIIGKYLDGIGFYHRQAEFSNKRNLFVKEVRGKLNGISKRDYRRRDKGS